MKGEARQKRQKQPKGTLSNDATTDSRFSQFQNDPRYRLPSRKDTHVKVDNRFSRMLKDEDYTRKAKVDRYGRTLSDAAGKKALNKLYDFEEEEEADGSDEADDDDEVQAEMKRVSSIPYDAARQGGFGQSSSEESSSESESDSEAEELDEQTDQEAGEIPTGEVTSRLAAVNMDWDNIRAADLMAVTSSLCPTKGRVRNVTVYPSEFGRMRMEREEVEGPAPEIFATTNSARNAPTYKENDSSGHEGEASESEDDEQIKRRLLDQSTGEEGNMEVNGRALRKYQLSRLRYYYAVITCDSAATAQAIYEEIDGSEYLSSANFFDLRFIPVDTTFDDPISDKVRDSCDKVPDDYRPSEFVTEALMHSKVSLTWDEDDSSRKEAQRRAFAQTEMGENDLQAYLGSESDSNSDDDEGKVTTDESNVKNKVKEPKKAEARAKMRALLGLSEDSDGLNPRKSPRDTLPHGNMQVTFTAGLSGDANAHSSAFLNKPEDVAEETTREKYIRKEKERKARRKAKAKASREGTDVAEESYSSAAEAADEPTTASVSTNGANDDPFNDPFFTNPEAANKTARKESKRLARQAKEEEAGAEAARKAKELEDLSVLMGEDASKLGGALFDMKRLRKAEKEALKRGKAKGKQQRNTSDQGQDMTTDVDVSDPRFGRVFESHEYAIDPTNAQFSGTKGMKKLLDEKRRRREDDFDGRPGETTSTQTKGKKRVAGEELDGLVSKMKRRKA